MAISPARQKRLEKNIATAMAEFGAEQVHKTIAVVLQRQQQGTKKLKRGARRYFSEDTYRFIWMTVRLDVERTGRTEYRSCMTLKMRFIIGGKMKDVCGRTLYRQYQHAIRFMKTNGHPDQEIPANYGCDPISHMKRQWRRELQFHLLSKSPASEWDQGFAELCGNSV